MVLLSERTSVEVHHMEETCHQRLTTRTTQVNACTHSWCTEIVTGQARHSGRRQKKLWRGDMMCGRERNDQRGTTTK